MTDKELRDQAVAKLNSAYNNHWKKTTKGYVQMQKPLPANSEWALGEKDFNDALGLLKQIGVVAPVPEPIPEPTPFRYSFRGLYDITPTLSHPNGVGGSILTGQFAALNFSAVTAFQNPTGSVSALHSILTQLHNAGTKGWVWMSGFKSQAAGGPVGGIMRMDQHPSYGTGFLEAVLNYTAPVDGIPVATKNHPALNVTDPDGVIRRRYHLADDTNLDYGPSTMQSLTQDKWAAEFQTIKRFGDRIKALDPKACTSASLFRTSPDHITPFLQGKYTDEIWLDGYPNRSPYMETYIPDQAKLAEAAGVPYLGVLSGHAYGGSVILPTPAVYAHMMDQWQETKMRGYLVYAWNAPDVAFNSQPTLKAQVTNENNQNAQ